MFRGSVFVSMKISQGKLLRARLEILGERRRENYFLGNSVIAWGSHDPIYVQPGCRGDLYCMSAYLPASPISLRLVRGILWYEWFTILQFKELLCKSGVRFLVSTIEARVTVGLKQDIKSPFPLVSKQAGHSVITPVVDMRPNVPLNFFTFTKIFIQCWSKSQLWNWAFPPVPEIKLL